MEQQAELIGEEVMAAQAISEAGSFEVFQPLLRLAPLDVPVVESQGRLGTRADDKASIGAFGQRFRFVDDAPWHGPALRLIGGLTSQAHLLGAASCLLALRFGEQGCSDSLQARIGDQADAVGDPLLLAEVTKGRDGKAAIGSNLNPHPIPAPAAAA